MNWEAVQADLPHSAGTHLKLPLASKLKGNGGPTILKPALFLNFLKLAPIPTPFSL